MWLLLSLPLLSPDAATANVLMHISDTCTLAGHTPPAGSWVELEFSSEEAPGQPGQQPATVHVGYLRRWAHIWMCWGLLACQTSC